MRKIRIAIAGVGNCASALLQGLFHYGETNTELSDIGLRHTVVGGYYPKDVEVVAAFDVDSRKVGKDLSEAILSEPNNTVRLASVPKLDVTVLKGPLLDGVGSYLKDMIKVDSSPETDVAQALQEKGAEILVNLVPSGAVKASKWYAEQAIQADCAFINATPVSIASDPELARHFDDAELPVVGDDLIDQIGATTLHGTLMRLLSAQGVRISQTYQLDVGGGTESLDTLERTRDIKRAIKTKSVESALPYKASVVAGTTDYVDFLKNRRDSYLWIEGLYFGRTPMEIELRLSTIDGPNSSSVLLDVIRAVKVALKRGESGSIIGISAYAFKHSLEAVPLEKAVQLFEGYIAPNS